MSEEVKINIRTEADTRGLDATKTKIQELRETMHGLEAERDRLRGRASEVEESGGDRKTRQKIAAIRKEADRTEKMGLPALAKRERASAAAMEKQSDAKTASHAGDLRASADKIDGDIQRTAKEIAGLEKTEQKGARDEKAKHLREQRAEDRAAAAAERASLAEKSAAEKAVVREVATEKKKHLQEEKVAAREQQAEETQRQRFGRALFGNVTGVGAGGLAGGAAMFGIGQVMTEMSERQGIALRAAAQRQMDVRGLAIAGSWRGSSSQTLVQAHALDDDIARQTANRPELERKARSGIWDSALHYGAAGAGTGFALSGGNPIGAAIGLVAGAATGAYKSFSEGEREKDEDKQTLAAKKKKRDELEALGKKQVREEDGQIEMDIASHRAERTMSGSRARVVDEAKKKYLHRYRELRSMNLSDEEANKTAGLESETAMRDRQIVGASGLVDARSGAGDIAAAANWARQSTPGMAEVTAAINGLHGTVLENSKAAERIDQSIK